MKTYTEKHLEVQMATWYELRNRASAQIEALRKQLQREKEFKVTRIK